MIDIILGSLTAALSDLVITDLIVIYFLIYIFVRLIELVIYEKVVNTSLFLKIDSPILQFCLLLYFLIPIHNWSMNFFPDQLLAQLLVTASIVLIFAFILQTVFFGSFEKGKKSNGLFAILIRKLLTKNAKKQVALDNSKSVDEIHVEQYSESQKKEVRKKIMSFISSSLASSILIFHSYQIDCLLAAWVLLLSYFFIKNDFVALKEKWLYLKSGHILLTK